MPFTIDKKLADNYSGYYEHDDGLSEWRRLGALDKSANITRLCSPLPHNNILEIGCGDGAILERLSTTGFGEKFTGLEISPSGVKKAQDRKIPNTEIQLFDGHEIAFPDKTFDLAILTHVIEHVEYPRKLIYEAARVAHTVFIEVPLEDTFRLSPDYVFDSVGHINFYNPKTIRRLVQTCGMTVLNARLSHSSRPLYIFRQGKLRGTLAHLTKDVALHLWPTLAANSLTYHYSLTCKTTPRE